MRFKIHRFPVESKAEGKYTNTEIANVYSDHLLTMIIINTTNLSLRSFGHGDNFCFIIAGIEK